MPRTPNQSRLRTVGMIDPARAYNTDGLKRYAGIGRTKVVEAMQGGLKHREYAGRLWFRGRDIIEWIFKESQS